MRVFFTSESGPECRPKGPPIRKVLDECQYSGHLSPLLIQALHPQPWVLDLFGLDLSIPQKLEFTGPNLDTKLWI